MPTNIALSRDHPGVTTRTLRTERTVIVIFRTKMEHTLILHTVADCHDVLGPIKETNHENRYILTMIDPFSRFGYAKAFPEVHASHIIKFIKNKIVKIYGPLSVIVTDNGRQFVSHNFQIILRMHKIKNNRT